MGFASQVSEFASRMSLKAKAKLIAVLISGASSVVGLDRDYGISESAGYGQDMNRLTRNINRLTGRMLEAYLDGESSLDSSLQEDLIREIAGSSTFGKLAEHIKKALRQKAKQKGWSPTADNIKREAEHALNRYTGKDPVIYFVEADQGLQSVVGGCTVAVAAAAVEDGHYAVMVQVKDVYDFSNNRKAPKYAYYSRFREELAVLATHGQYGKVNEKFDVEWDRSPVTGGDMKLGPMNKRETYASLLYAMEKAGIYRGVAWSVLVPVTDEMTGATSSVSSIPGHEPVVKPAAKPGRK
jgi:hypothetical protein